MGVIASCSVGSSNVMANLIRCGFPAYFFFLGLITLQVSASVIGLVTLLATLPF